MRVWNLCLNKNRLGCCCFAALFLFIYLVLHSLVLAHSRVNDPMAKLQFLRVGWGGWGWWRSLNLHTCWMLRNCACLVIAHMLDATQVCLSCHCTHAGCYATVFGGICLVVLVQNERAAELAWSTRQISPKSQQREKMVTKRRLFFGGWFQ